MDNTRKPRAQPLLPAGEMLQQRCRTHAHGRLSQSARDGELRGLGHAVVDHLRGNLDRTLAGNKNDAAPVALLHPGQIVPAQANTQNIYSKK